MKKIAFYTLGCKLNFSESSTLARQFELHGYIKALREESADVCVINTCSVTADADKKCRNVIRKVVRENPGAIVAVTGCYAQLRATDLAAIDGVDVVVSNNNKGELFDRIAEFEKSRTLDFTPSSELKLAFFPSFSSGDRTRTFLKVQDGCNYHCSYCTIPMARGESRNPSIANLITQAQEIAALGSREIVLTGVNIGDFGRSTGESFLELIQALDRIYGIERYRISSIEPNLLTDEIIAFCATSKKFQPHFHIPLQSGSDKILSQMRRRYTTAKYAERLAAVRIAMPDAFIGIDIIVGFPGETEEDFEQVCQFLESQEPAFLHIFPYSARPGTIASEMPQQVDPKEKARRVKVLEQISDRLHRRFASRFIGTRMKILVESVAHQGKMYGYTKNYIKVEIPADKDLINHIIDVDLLKMTTQGNIEAAAVINKIK